MIVGGRRGDLGGAAAPPSRLAGRRGTTAGAAAPARVAPPKDRAFRLLMTAPAVLAIVGIGLFPAIFMLAVSFQNVTLMFEDTSFHGLANYRALLSDERLWRAIGHTLVFLAIALPAELLLGLVMAYLFLDRMPGKQIFVALLVLPVVISPIVAGATWRLLLDDRYGPINHLLSIVTGREVDILWTVDATWVYPAILIAEIWQWTPFMFLLLLAALSNVDRSQIEAAEIDGAGFWRRFRLVVLPAIWPVLVIAVIIRALDLFRLFDVVWALTKGGPGTMTETFSIYAYVRGFQQFDTSYTAAMAFALLVTLSIIVTLILRRVEIDR